MSIKEETSAEFLNRLGIDGQIWAKEFIKLWGKKKKEIDESLMISWFSNAIMAGYDKGKQKMIEEFKEFLKRECFKDCINEECQKEVLERLDEELKSQVEKGEKLCQ